MTNKQNIQEITVKLKTFHNTRELFTFTVDPSLLISSLLEKVNEIESTKNLPIEKRWAKGKQYRIFSCNPKIRELNPKASFTTEKINNNEILILLPQKKLFFSEYMKGSSVILAKSNQIAIKRMDDFQYVLGTLPFSFGKHYFEICLLTEPLEKSVVIGVCSKRDNNNLLIYDVKSFWGYVLSDLKKMTYINSKTEILDFGELTKIYDRIGVLVDFTKEGVNISYYANKILLGQAFTKIQEKVLFPCVRLGIETTKVMITNQVDFPDV